MTRMKRVNLSILVILLLMTTVSATALAELKIGYIRPPYILSQYEPYLEAEEQLLEYQESEQNKLTEMQVELDNKIEDYETREMSEELQQQSQQEIANMRQAIQDYYNELVGDDGLFAQKQQELISPIIDDIDEILMELGDVEEFDFIIDANTGGLIYAGEQYDLSDRVLNELNKRLSSQ